MKTLLLDPNTWDFVLDSNNNLAIASNPYAIAQDVSSACKLIAGELYYDTTQGIPYFDSILGHSDEEIAAVYSSMLEEAALGVPEVVSAKCTELYYADTSRQLTGTIEVIDTQGNALNVTF